ncbi:MAG TPA: hypothetical protein VFA21_03480 [Pyrinomonadaceae bacterium]|jgi:hypothetical protein|nr:hypothetical protein [Pyrinomonadaceae bacterium]
MKSLLARTNFFAVIAAALVLSTAASAQTNEPPPPPPAPAHGGGVAIKAGPAEWREFKSEAGGFTVKFPAAPHIEEMPYKIGPVAFTRHAHVAFVEGGMTFEVDYADMTAGDSDPALVSEVGIGALVSGMTSHGATLLSSGTVVRGTCAGREATLSLPARQGRGSGFMQARVFISGRRYYALFFNAAEDTPRARAMGREFVESFSVAGGCKAQPAPVVAPPSKVEVGIIEGTRDAATGWRRIEEPELGFDVLMPGVTHHESAQAQAQPFPIMHDTFTSEDGGAFFSAEALGEYPQDFDTSPVARAALMDATTYSLKKNFEAHGSVIAPLGDVKLGAIPGREFSISNEKSGARGRAQIYVTLRRAYVFVAFTRGEVPDAAKVLERFFSSIKLSTPAPTPPAPRVRP